LQKHSSTGLHSKQQDKTSGAAKQSAHLPIKHAADKSLGVQKQTLSVATK
jgi:hypothetical protein